MDGEGAQVSTGETMPVPVNENENDSQIKKRGPGGKQPGAGRPPAIVPTDEDRQRVERLAGLGLPLEQIGAVIGPPGGINKDTVAKYFAAELIRGRAKANEAVGQTLYSRAVAGDAAAMIWWSKVQMRWSAAPQEIRIQSDTRVSIAGALEAAQARVIEGEAIERVVGAMGGPSGDAEGEGEEGEGE